MIYVYKTKECEKDIQKHSLNKQVESFMENVHNTQRTTMFDNFPSPYLKKRFTDYRLIASVERINDDVIIVFCRILGRNSREYKNKTFPFNNKYWQDNYGSLVNSSDLQKWLKKIKKEDPVQEKRKPSIEEHKFLYSLIGADDSYAGDYFLYETNKWIESIQTDELKNRLINIPKVLVDIIDNPGKHNKNLSCFRTFDSKYRIVYRLFPERKILFLIDIVTIENYNKENYFDFFRTNNNKFIDQTSGKSYPSLILADDDLWIKIENNQGANLALSPEETDLIHSVHKDGKNEGFPLFINGRAGSGKSLVLQYLFADYLKSFYNCKLSSIKAPIYLTYSDSLVEKSKQIIKNLLKLNYNHHSNKIDINDEMLNTSIQEFKKFLISKLPESAKIRFSPENYIDYSSFKNHWKNHFSNDPNAIKKYNPDISWHVIRSYIKGTSIDGYLEEEEYLELSKDEKSVSQEVFKLIFDKVWTKWYKKEYKDHWDDQDLVRYLLDNNLITPIYPGVFCDEAQDFSKIELELLLRLNFFTEVKIDSKILKRVPFVFAGDPFQTLNPTGFRWEAIKSTYVEKFIHSLTPELRYGNPNINYQELKFNYRSSESIVKLCNSVQLLRTVIFDYNNETPQQTWKNQKEKSAIPKFFDIDNTPGIKEVIKNQDSLPIIIPCNEGEEEEFVKNDEFLNELIERDVKGVPRNVFSPMRAKGLEFSRIIVYKFGQYSLDKLNFNKRDLSHYKKYDSDKKITLEYFINQLYVALSRAEKRLFILDSKLGFESLWPFARDFEFQTELLSNCRNEKDWKDQTGVIVQGNEKSWLEEKENPILLAKQYFEAGINSRDPWMLSQAAIAFGANGNSEKQAECYAIASEFENDYKKSGGFYIECNNYEKALDVFWKGGFYNEIMEMTKKNGSSLLQRLEVRISIQLSTTKKGTNISTIKILLSDLLEHFKNKEYIKIFWSKAIAKLLIKILNDKSVISKDWGDFMDFSKNLSDYVNIPPEIIAEYAFNAKKYSDAVIYYESAKQFKTKNYLISKIWVIEQKIKNDEIKDLSGTDFDIITKHYFENKKHEKVFDVLKKSNNSDKMFELLNLQLDLSDEILKSMLHDYMSILINKSDFSLFIDHLEHITFTSKNIKKIFSSNKSKYQLDLIQELATNPLMPEKDRKIREKVSKYLKKHFIIADPTTWYKRFYPELIGAAFERTDIEINGIVFYKKIFGSDLFDSESKDRAKIRWAHYKYQQALYEESIRNKTKALEIRRETNRVVNNLNITDINSEPVYPSVAGFLSTPIPLKQKAKVKSNKKANKIEPNSTIKKVEPELIKKEQDEKMNVERRTTKNKIKPAKVKDITETLSVKSKLKDTVLNIGHLNINVKRNNNRINIENTINSNQISIYLKDKICKSHDFDFEVSGNTFRGKDFGINISFIEGFSEVKIENIELGIEVMIKYDLHI